MKRIREWDTDEGETDIPETARCCSYGYQFILKRKAKGKKKKKERKRDREIEIEG